MAQDTTIDGLLDRRVMLEQPANGYRVAVDTVLLAAAVHAEAGQKALDLGCGAGGALLCLACRVPGVMIRGVEIQNDLAQLCRANIVRNNFATDVDAYTADATDLPHDLESIFDHTFMNPPYHEESRHDVSAHGQKRTANSEKSGDLALWIAAVAKALKPTGLITLIHRADRLDELLGLLQAGFGAIEILTILPKAGAAPKRIILRARKGAPSGVTNCRNFVLHQADGRYTEEAEAVLRHMKVLLFLK